MTEISRYFPSDQQLCPSFEIGFNVHTTIIDTGSTERYTNIPNCNHKIKSLINFEKPLKTRRANLRTDNSDLFSGCLAILSDLRPEAEL